VSRVSSLSGEVYSSPSHGQVTECVIFVDVVDLLFLVGRRSASLRTFVARREVVRCPSVQHDNIDTCVRECVWRTSRIPWPCSAAVSARVLDGLDHPVSRGARPRPRSLPGSRLLHPSDLPSDCALWCECSLIAHSPSLQLYCMQSINRNKTPTQLRTCGANNPAKPA
jgi:hypothetical protein